jgi:hypothetical protein
MTILALQGASSWSMPLVSIILSVPRTRFSLPKFIGTSPLTSTVRIRRPYYTLSLILVFINYFVHLFLKISVFSSTSSPRYALNVGALEDPLKADLAKKGRTFLASIDYSLVWFPSKCRIARRMWWSNICIDICWSSLDCIIHVQGVYWMLALMVYLNKQESANGSYPLLHNIVKVVANRHIFI